MASNGGCDCKVRGITIASSSGQFAVGDRVCLRNDFLGDGWILGPAGSGKVGVVCDVPKDQASSSASDLREILVCAIDDAQAVSFYRGAWLTHARNDGVVAFKKGDCVQLDPASFRKGMESRCLGSPSDFLYGVVVDQGVVRNSVQRNVLVATDPVARVQPSTFLNGSDHADSITPSPSESTNHLVFSHYSSQALMPAALPLIVTDADTRALTAEIAAVLASVGIQADAHELVRRFGVRVWSKLSPLFSKTPEQLLAALLRWQASRSARTEISALHQACDQAADRDSDSILASAEFDRWACASCQFADNRGPDLSCRICALRARRTKCSKCSVLCRFKCAQCGEAGQHSLPLAARVPAPPGPGSVQPKPTLLTYSAVDTKAAAAAGFTRTVREELGEDEFRCPGGPLNLMSEPASTGVLAWEFTCNEQNNLYMGVIPESHKDDRRYLREKKGQVVLEHGVEARFHRKTVQVQTTFTT